jgi:hypothetical protein|tara:strand:- start:96 stop:491 length:396 start_codon:yes stop_codon:yes gene_type:complete
MLKDRSNGLAGNESQVLLQEILDNQKEALDLNGQLVLLNQKMDVLIEKVGEQAAKPKSNLELLLGNHQAMFSIVFVILVALFLGLGDAVVDRFVGDDGLDSNQLQQVLHVLQEAAQGATLPEPNESLHSND